MYESTTQGLRTGKGEKVALQSVKVEVVFNDLLCETIMTQAYRNQEDKLIEAVYTFPLSSNAVLLSLTVAIDGREMQGVVVEKSSAEEQYEEAITDGNAAIMLEKLQSGLYTMNVGNILAGEEVVVSMVYAELYSWQGDTLRFHLPTTIAPRYDDPETAGLQPHQVPEYDLGAENRFCLKMAIAGNFAVAEIESPSHQITVTRYNKKAIVALATGEFFMDRDFILNIRLPQIAQDTGLIDRDFDGGFVALASFAPRLPSPEKIPPRSLKIMVDCSGSMGGDSINQARQAISDILAQLRPEDYFNLIAFGSTFKTFFDHQAKADQKNITKIKRWLRSLDADMGGTEMQEALEAAIMLPGPDMPQDILLITDGEVWKTEEMFKIAGKSGHRIFTVGVGSSVSEAFVRQLAQESGGACELVVPGEKMAEKIVRHFNRIYLPRAENVAVHWPTMPEKIVPGILAPVYDGDTLHVFACFNEKPSGAVILDMTLTDGRKFTQAAFLSDMKNITASDGIPGPIVRLAMQQALAGENKENATKLAVQYQLVSANTNYLVVASTEVDKTGQELPSLRKVPQMFAAGWGGVGRVCENRASYNQPSFLRRSSEPGVLFCHAQSQEEKDRRRQDTTPGAFAFYCSRVHAKWLRPVLLLANFNDLLDCNLPDRILETLEAINKDYDPETSEEIIVLAFLYVLTQSVIGKEFNRYIIRAITKACKTTILDERLINLIEESFADISREEWGAQYSLEYNVSQDDASS